MGKIQSNPVEIQRVESNPSDEELERRFLVVLVPLPFYPFLSFPFLPSLDLPPKLKCSPYKLTKQIHPLKLGLN